MSDLISRQAAIEALRDEFKRTPTNAIRAMDTIKNLPSAQPELETVKCIIGESCMDIGDADFSMKCAKCGAEYYHVEYYDYDYNFCPNCGRRWRKQGG